MASKAGKAVTSGGTGNSPFGKSAKGSVTRGKGDAAVTAITAGKQTRKGSTTNHFSAKMANPKQPKGCLSLIHI